MGKKQIKLHLFDCKTFCKLVTHSLEGILQKKNRGLSLPNLHLADEWLRGCGLAPIADRAVRKGSCLPGIDWSYLKKLNQILYHIWAVHEVTVQYCVALPFSKNRHQIQTPNATFYMGWYSICSQGHICNVGFTQRDYSLQQSNWWLKPFEWTVLKISGFIYQKCLTNLRFVAHSNQSELILHLFHLFGTTKAALWLVAYFWQFG